MRLACIWNDEKERATVEHELRNAEPSWELVFFPWEEVAALDPLLNILRGGYSAILLHLSTPPCGALKLAEIHHRDKLSTQIILTSRTPADPGALTALFSGRIHPEDDVYGLAAKISSILKTPPRYLSSQELERAIVSVLNTDDLLKIQFMQVFREKRLRKLLTFDDYRRFCHISLVEASVKSSRVFISYASKDRGLVEEITDSLMARGVNAFMASRDIEGGDLWESNVKDAITKCSEMLVVITPNSKERPWVLIEVGAGWVLGKHVTPCVAYVDIDQLPEAISKSQARPIVTNKDREKLVNEVCARLGLARTSEPAG